MDGMREWPNGKPGKPAQARDYTGQIFGNLIAIEPTEKRVQVKIVWKLVCIKCNTTTLKVPSTLGYISNCGNPECRVGIRNKDLVGLKFGNLVVNKFELRDKTDNVVWSCTCFCGKTFLANSNRLLSGTASNCGCIYAIERRKPPGETSWNTRWSSYLSNVKERRNRKGKSFENEFTKELFIEKSSLDCFYCERPPMEWNKYLKENGQVTSKASRMSQEGIDRAWININGLDRVDNSVGYLLSNTVPCCPDCNFMKHSSTLSEWCSIIERFQPGFTIKIMNKLQKENIVIPKD